MKIWIVRKKQRQIRRERVDNENTKNKIQEKRKRIFQIDRVQKKPLTDEKITREYFDRYDEERNIRRGRQDKRKEKET